jgi:predicted amidophosphoribosyltransferase
MPLIVRAGEKKTAKYICGICGHEIKKGASYCSACRLEINYVKRRYLYKGFSLKRLEQIVKERRGYL